MSTKNRPAKKKLFGAMPHEDIGRGKKAAHRIGDYVSVRAYALSAGLAVVEFSDNGHESKAVR